MRPDRAARRGLDFADFKQRWVRAATTAGFTGSYVGAAADGVMVWRRSATQGCGSHVLISAGIHGDEPAGCLAMLRLMEEQRLAPDIEWTIFPALNPWGLQRGCRDNRDGIDLNRDYRRRASAESRAHAAWLERLARAPNLHLSLHEDWEASGFYLYEINTGSGPSVAGNILQAVQPVLALEQGPVVDDHLLDAPGLICHTAEADDPDGWPEAIFLARRFPLLSCTFETPSTRFPFAQRVQAHGLAVEAAIQALRH